MSESPTLLRPPVSYVSIEPGGLIFQSSAVPVEFDVQQTLREVHKEIAELKKQIYRLEKLVRSHVADTENRS